MVDVILHRPLSHHGHPRAIMAVLLASGGALVVILLGLGALNILAIIQNQTIKNLVAVQVQTRAVSVKKALSTTAPILGTTQNNDGTESIIELDPATNLATPVFTYDPADGFTYTIFAVPQEHYTGVVYLRAQADADLSGPMLFPLSVNDGTLGTRLFTGLLPKQTNAISLSPNQEYIAALYPEKAGNNDPGVPTEGSVVIWSLATGAALRTFTPEEIDAFPEDSSLLSRDPGQGFNGYNGEAPSWINFSCFQKYLWDVSVPTSPAYVTHVFCL